MTYSLRFLSALLATVAMQYVGCSQVQEVVGKITTFDNIAKSQIRDVACFQDAHVVAVIAQHDAEIVSFDPFVDPIRVVRRPIPGRNAVSITSESSALPSMVVSGKPGGGALFRISLDDDWGFVELTTSRNLRHRALSVPAEYILLRTMQAANAESVITGNRIVNGHLKEVFRLPTESSRLWKHYAFTEELDCYAVSPDGSQVVLSHPNADAMPIIDTASGRVVGEFKNAEEVRRFTAASFSPDGSLLVATNVNGRVTLWDVKSRKFVRDIDTIAPSVTHEVRFLNQGKLLFVCFPMNEVRRRSAIKFWDGITFEPIVDIVSMLPPENEESRTLTAVATSEDGSRVVIGDGGGRVHIWTAPAGDLRFHSQKAP